MLQLPSVNYIKIIIYEHSLCGRYPISEEHSSVDVIFIIEIHIYHALS